MADARLRDAPVLPVRERLAEGGLKAADYLEPFLERCLALGEEPNVFAHLDADHARRQARALETYRLSRRPLGPMHAIPVLLEDLIDVGRVQTGAAAPDGGGRTPQVDSPIAGALRTAGAVLLAKTASPKAGIDRPDEERTLARLIAEGAAPVGIGTDIDGSLLRSAARRHVFAYRPSAGSVPLEGIAAASPTLQGATLVGRDLPVLALAAETIFQRSIDDAFPLQLPHPRLGEAVASDPPVPPTFAVLGRNDAAGQAVEAFGEIVELLDQYAFEAELPPIFGEAIANARRIRAVEAARALAPAMRRQAEMLDPHLKALAEEGGRVLAVEYLSSLDWRTVLQSGIDVLFDRCDALLVPTDLEIGDDPERPAIATLTYAMMGLPLVSLPLLADEEGRAIGLMLVGRRHEDGRLLRTAASLQRSLTSDGE